mmetsp:Transcript_90655/g.287218  ORF Transcript_90655/g.287218 Transcript_90655/m.287218 type:complete len:264 (-) Transcript_90655:160-951(-)
MRRARSAPAEVCCGRWTRHHAAMTGLRPLPPRRRWPSERRAWPAEALRRAAEENLGGCSAGTTVRTSLPARSCSPRWRLRSRPRSCTPRARRPAAQVEPGRSPRGATPAHLPPQPRNQHPRPGCGSAAPLGQDPALLQGPQHRRAAGAGLAAAVDARQGRRGAASEVAPRACQRLQAGFAPRPSGPASAWRPPQPRPSGAAAAPALAPPAAGMPSVAGERLVTSTSGGWRPASSAPPACAPWVPAVLAGCPGGGCAAGRLKTN